MSDLITIKGIREGLLITIDPDPTEWMDVVGQLAKRVDDKKGFFKGARVALDVADRPVRPHELDALRIMLGRRDITLWAIISNSPTTQQVAQGMGLETALIQGQEQLETPAFSNEESGDAGIFIDHTLRSGRQVRSSGHVTVFGDVNAGAEIVAGGNIIVWGKVRGMVHAGASGNEQAVVCALDLAPTQLRIATYITISPNDKRRKPQPEMASVQQGRIVAETWKT